MRRLLVAIPIAVLAVGGSTACATKKFVRTSVGQVNDKVDSLGKSLEETQERPHVPVRNRSRLVPGHDVGRLGQEDAERKGREILAADRGRLLEKILLLSGQAHVDARGTGRHHSSCTVNIRT